MFTAVVGVLGGLAIVAWAVVAWASKRRQPWLMAPLALFTVVLVAVGQPGWALLPVVALAAGSFAELVIGAREAPTLRTKEPDAPLSTERWAAAVAAPFRVALAEPWDVVARPQLRRRYRKVFEAEWGVVDRETLLAAVDRLWEELHTGHSADLVVDLRTGVVRSRAPEGRREEETALLSPGQVARMREITGVDESDETVVIGAYQWWKSVHLIRLACGGATLDWLSPVETQSLLRRIASDLQRRYAGWQQLAEAFHGGYLMWHGGGSDDADSDRVWTALGLLTTDPASPWNLLPWDMPLERVTPEHGMPSAQPH
ncbi:hypothetical protein HDA32_003647 [Spinactinospora alkalitolerans]|uniref:DUF1266 domain-containing protein n=1 Tax=Spinactinospora alkalitolerans TaxID=687207 RepID=A0A852TYZ5_9ACTN|nr:DUF1266 domain-containing protein [Spinactinospora alkalitolerans]NYE48527.1 hypothetical protein [Spinactinospora alkalitolerans]